MVAEQTDDRSGAHLPRHAASKLWCHSARGLCTFCDGGLNASLHRHHGARQPGGHWPTGHRDAGKATLPHEPRASASRASCILARYMHQCCPYP